MTQPQGKQKALNWIHNSLSFYPDKITAVPSETRKWVTSKNELQKNWSQIHLPVKLHITKPKNGYETIQSSCFKTMPRLSSCFGCSRSEAFASTSAGFGSEHEKYCYDRLESVWEIPFAHGTKIWFSHTRTWINVLIQIKIEHWKYRSQKFEIVISSFKGPKMLKRTERHLL